MALTSFPTKPKDQKTMTHIYQVSAECPQCGSENASRITGSSDLKCDDCNCTFNPKVNYHDQMLTYTIAFTPDMLIATVPDGQDIRAAVAAYGKDAGEIWNDGNYDIETGLILTNDPDEALTIIFTSIRGSCGFLTDANGKTYDYAVRDA